MISAHFKDDTPMFVFGVNYVSYAGKTIISKANCTTNALSPITKGLNEKWGVKRGLMNIARATTDTQKNRG